MFSLSRVLENIHQEYNHLVSMVFIILPDSSPVCANEYLEKQFRLWHLPTGKIL